MGFLLLILLLLWRVWAWATSWTADLLRGMLALVATQLFPQMFVELSALALHAAFKLVDVLVVAALGRLGWQADLADVFDE